MVKHILAITYVARVDMYRVETQVVNRLGYSTTLSTSVRPGFPWHLVASRPTVSVLVRAEV